MPTSDPTVNIVMCTYNGAAFIDAQLQSFVDQTHGNWRLWVSDDASGDDTLAKVTAFAKAYPNREVRILKGPCKGSAANFLSVLPQPELAGAWVAFSDQDDVWFKEKLTRAIALINGRTLAVYAARTLQTDADLAVTKGSPTHHRPYGFGNALVQNVLGGNTIVMPPAMTDVLRQSLPAATAAKVPFHDWWVYLMATAAGAEVINDRQPVLYYRQHGANEMGAAVNAKLSRFRMLRSRQYAGWIDRNLAALLDLDQVLTADNFAMLKRFANWRARSRMLRPAPQSLGLYRQTKAGNAILRALARSGRL